MTSIIAWEKDNEGVVTLTIDDKSQNANTLTEQFFVDLEATVNKLEAEKENISGVIVTSGKDMFFAGADIHAVYGLTIDQRDEFAAGVDAFKALLRRLETLGRPVVAAINGTALGGGFEICLACHYRVALDKKKSEIGLPEVMIGLLPGGGGVVRTVRMLGIQDALMNVLLQGQRMKPAKAKSVGIVDEVADSPETMFAAARKFIKENPKAEQPWDARGYKMPGGKPSNPQLAMQLPAFPANLMKQIKGANYPAPKAIMSAAVEGAQVDFDAAQKIEGRYFLYLALGKESKNMMKGLFMDLQAIKKGNSRPGKDEHPVWKASKIGVIGAGLMGHGIAYVSATRGIDVVLLDRSAEDANRGRDALIAILDKRVQRKRMTQEQRDETAARVVATSDYADLKGCELVIEAVFEDRGVKAEVTKQIEAAVGTDVLLGSNTSTLPITGLAEAATKPESFIGIHFFSPVDKMPLVEIICGDKTDDATLAKTFDYVLQIGKTPIVVNDSRGFYTSRTIGAYINEGMEMLVEGYPALSIEQAALQAGTPVGPLTVSDEVNLGLALKIQQQTKADLEAAGEKFPETASWKVFSKMVDELDRPGRRQGKGFYEYPEGGKKHIWQGLRDLWAKEELAAPTPAQFNEMQERLLYMFAIETARCYHENVLRNVPDANIGAIFGIGMPAWTGGPLQYINYVGAKEFVARADEFVSKYGTRFAPPDALRAMAEKGEVYV